MTCGWKRRRNWVSPIFRPRRHADLETFFDGKVFDPDNITAYLEGLAIKKIA